jgi:hypothetical protein
MVLRKLLNLAPDGKRENGTLLVRDMDANWAAQQMTVKKNNTQRPNPP